MTPGVVAAQKAGIKFSIRQYRHDRNAASYGAEAAQKSEVDAATIFKTLVVQADSGELMVTVVPVLGRLDLKSAATALQVKKLKMADKERGQRATGYVLWRGESVGAEASAADGDRSISAGAADDACQRRPPRA